MGKFTAILLAGLLTLPASMAIAGSGSGSGSFGGMNGHQASGAVEVVKTADGWEVHLNDSFTFDGAPDPWVGFGKSGSFAPATDFHRLRSNTGTQV